MSTQGKSRSWWPRIAVVAVLFALAMTGMQLFRKHRDQEARELDDRSVITRMLAVSPNRVINERITIDDYRDYFGVYFVCTADGPQMAEVLKRMGFRDYSLDSQEKHDLVLHAQNYKHLKNLAWGPMSKFSGCPQYVGVFEKEYLVYVAICGGQAYGYLENNYNVPAGPGPFK